MNVKTEKGNFQINALIPYMGVLLVFGIFGILTRGKLFSFSSLGNLLNNGLLIMICSVAAVPVFARGEMDFSLGSTEGICILLVGYIIFADINMRWLGLLVCVVTGGLIGLLNGVINNILKIPSFVATISMNYILRGIIYTLIDIKGSSYPTAYAANYKVWECFIVLLAVILLTYFLMENTKMGKVEKLYGENHLAAEFSGINNTIYGILAFVYLGVMVAIASFLITPRFTLVQATVGNTLAIDVLIACMIGGLNMSGGMGTKISRPIIGSVIIAALNQGYALLNVESSIVQFTKGFLFIIILAITAPNMEGIFGKLFRKIKKQG